MTKKKKFDKTKVNDVDNVFFNELNDIYCYTCKYYNKKYDDKYDMCKNCMCNSIGWFLSLGSANGIA